MARTKEEGGEGKPQRSKNTSRRSSEIDDSSRRNLENGLYVHSSPPKLVSDGEGSSGSAKIREYLRGGNIAGLEEVVLEGNGNKLLTQSSTDPKVRAFLKTLPSFMSKIDLVHDAAERGNLRNLKSLLDRRKLAKSKDSQGLGLLHKAVLSGNPEIIDYLVENYPETAEIMDNAQLLEATINAEKEKGRQDSTSGVSSASYHIGEGEELDGYNPEDSNDLVSDEKGLLSANPDDQSEDLAKLREILVQTLPSQAEGESSFYKADDDHNEDVNKIFQKSTKHLGEDETFQHSYGLVELFLEDIMEEDEDNIEQSETKSNVISTNSKPNSSTASHINDLGDEIDLNASHNSLNKKLPLPSTASGLRTKVIGIDDVLLSKGNHPGRIRLEPVNKSASLKSANQRDSPIPSGARLNLDPLEIVEYGELVPNSDSQNSGAIPKTFSGRLRSGLMRYETILSERDRANVAASNYGSEEIRGSLTASSFGHRIQKTETGVIKELLLRRNRIKSDHISRMARERAALQNVYVIEEMEDDMNESNNYVKLPELVRKSEMITVKSKRPDTPPVLPRSAAGRMPINDLILEGKHVSFIKFSNHVFEEPKHGLKTAKLRKKRSASIKEKAPITKPEEQPNKSFLDLSHSLGNLILNTEKKIYDSRDNQQLPESRKSAGSDSARGNLEGPDTGHVQPEPFQDLSGELQKFCRRLHCSISAAIQNDLNKIYRRETIKELSKEDTIQIIYEHDVGYWAKQITGKALDKVTLKEQLNKTYVIKTRDAESADDSGIASSSLSTATQTSRTATPQKNKQEEYKEDDIGYKLRQLNITVIAGKPVYRRLVEAERQENELKKFVSNWRPRHAT